MMPFSVSLPIRKIKPKPANRKPHPLRGGVSQSSSAVKSQRDLALSGLDPETRAEVLQDAADAGLYDKDDAAWWLLRRFRDGMSAADRAVDAAERIEDATKNVGDMIFKQTHAAGEDLKSLVSQGIRETTLDVGKKIGGAIQIVVQRGAEQIKAAAGEVDQTARDKLSAMTQEYRVHLSRAAMQEATRHSAFVGAVRWGVVATAIFWSIIFGVVNGWLGYSYTHTQNITPPNLKIYRQPGGAYIAAFGGRFRVRRIACKDSLCLGIAPVK